MRSRYFLAVLSALFLLLWLNACSAQPPKASATPTVPLPTQTLPTQPLPLVPTLLPPVSLTATPPGQPAPTTPPTPAPTVTPLPRPTVGRLASEENRVFHASPGEATQQVPKPAARAVGEGDEVSTDRDGMALLTFDDLWALIYRDSRLRADDVTPLETKLALGQGAVLEGQVPQARKHFLFLGDPPLALIVMSGTAPAPTKMPRPHAPVATTTPPASWSPPIEAEQQINQIYFVAPLSSADNRGMTDTPSVGWGVFSFRGEFSTYSGTSTASQPLSVQSGMWAIVPPVGASGSAPPPRAVTYAQLKNLVRDESDWNLIRDIELDAACLSAARLPLASEQGQGVSCPLPSLTVASPPVYECINPVFRVTLRGQAAPGCPEAQLACVAWEWGDGTSDVQAFPANHDFASAGKYPVTVKAYDSLGQTTSLQVPLKVACPTAVPQRQLPFVEPFTSPLPVESSADTPH